MAFRKKRKKIIAVSVILIVLALSIGVFFLATQETGIVQDCRGSIGTGIMQGSNPVAGGCVIAPFSTGDSVQWFTDSDTITIDCLFSGDISGGTYSYVSTSKYPYACDVLRYGRENGRDFWCNTMEEYHTCGMPSNSGRQVLCGSHIYTPGDQNKVGGQPVALENGSIYHLVPEDTSVTANCKSFSSALFQSGESWTYSNLRYFHSTPKISCDDKITATNEAQPIQGMNRKQEFKLKSTCSGTAVVGFNQPTFELGLGESISVGYRANGDGKCDVYLQNVGSLEQATCVIDVSEFVEQQPTAPVSIGDIMEQTSSPEESKATLYVILGSLVVIFIILVTYYIVVRGRK